jgi:signal transduction histidine kinase
VEAFGEGFDPARLWGYGDKIRRVSEDTITKIIDNFRRTVETVISIAYKALMTQHLHLESVSASYQDLAETNRRLRSSVEKLKEMDRLKASFLAMISHELRTPLTSIIGYSEMLAEGMAGDMTDEQKEFVATIREKGESLLGLIGSLLDISKIEAGAVTLALGDMKIEDVVRSAVRTLVPQAQKKKVELRVKLDPGLGSIIADYDKVNQSMVNLLANAVKFTPEGGSVTLKVYVFEGERRYSGSTGRFGSAEERFLRADIIDTGIGIPKEKLEDVFKAFYQVDNSFTREYGGTGLGLAIVKSFVEAHKGEVWVDSEPQQGTTFSLLFPMDLDENVPSAISFTSDL